MVFWAFTKTHDNLRHPTTSAFSFLGSAKRAGICGPIQLQPHLWSFQWCTTFFYSNFFFGGGGTPPPHASGLISMSFRHFYYNQYARTYIRFLRISMTDAPTSWLPRLIAFWIWLKRLFRRRVIIGVNTQLDYCLTRPPIGATSDTPGTCLQFILQTKFLQWRSWLKSFWTGLSTKAYKYTSQRPLHLAPLRPSRCRSRTAQPDLNTSNTRLRAQYMRASSKIT